ncbi:MAG: RecQ family ATP-dependent DNA helicase [Chitinophagaceae bacterium]|nr:RecQ family ATP-dependent DNA helicase [Chitinophagaceae bacterium]
MLNIHQILKQYWGFNAFRPLQEDIIHSVLSGIDSLALMPTGGGKSLCYQVPAMGKEGMCLVISPLIALMKDQVENLRKKGITAYSIFSGMSRKEVIHTLETVTNSNCKFLYISPERLETSLFKEYLPGMHINLVAVDEAHCISQWGYDFRPPYLRIAALREELPDVPVLALTASATPDVQKDICDRLSFTKPAIFRQSFERPNLSYSVFKVDSRINKIIEILNRVPGTGIVYCKSRKRTKEISELLQLQNISADYYHAGLTQEERNGKQETWINNKTRVIVCTNAFGMGIDKPDVRTVIHADVPDCLENYYQEAGRAGRDGKTAYAVLLYDEREIQELQEMPAIRFPSQADIRTVYLAVANYLQVPAGTGEGEYYDFDLADFLKKFKINSHTAVYSLKALEQEGWLSFNEQIFLPSTVQFTATKDYLYQFEKDNPMLEPVIKSLLRAYGGIFDHTCTISELQVAQLARKEAEEVKKQLLQLHAARIIDYTPRKDSPQLLLMRNRVKAEELTVNIAAYQKRKEIFQQRVAEMVRYVKEEADCRSRMIGVYFGDKDIRSCGICDNCLRRKTVTLTKEEFESIHSHIYAVVENEKLFIKDLMLRLGGIKKEKVWKVIEFLQAENKIEVADSGFLQLKQ